METISQAIELHTFKTTDDKTKHDKRYRLSASSGMDIGDYEDACLFMEMLPKEIHFYIFTFLKAADLKNLALTSKEMKEFAQDDLLWKGIYIEKWLKTADDNFINKYFPKNFEWRRMYKTRVTVEAKYLSTDETKRTAKIDPPHTEEWKTYLRKGKSLAKHETEDIELFLLLASIEQEEYKSAAALASKEKDKKLIADVYYYWGRCIKDLSRNKLGEEKTEYLLQEEDKYKTAFSYEPSDSYILYSWAINLRFQLEFVEGEKAVEVYRKSSSKYREALKNGYIEKYVLWGLGSLKLHMAKKSIASNDLVSAENYLQKATKKYGKLQTIWEEGDNLTAFSLSFNNSCISVCNAKICANKGDIDGEAKYYETARDRLKDCTRTKDFKEFLTLDLLDLWYFDDFRQESWFMDIYRESKPKKLNASW